MFGCRKAIERVGVGPSATRVSVFVLSSLSDENAASAPLRLSRSKLSSVEPSALRTYRATQNAAVCATDTSGIFF